MATNVCPRLEGVVALVDEPPVFPVAFDGLVGEDACRSQSGNDEDAGDDLFHSPKS